MTIRLKPLAAALFLSSIMALPAHAEAKKSLESSVANLEKEVASLKSQLHQKNNFRTHRNAAPASASASTSNDKKTSNAQNVHSTSSEEFTSQDYLPFDPDVPGEAYVSSGPYIGIDITFAGSNLIINSPSVNTDLQLLNLRKNIIKQLDALLHERDPGDTHSHLLLSGVVETQASYHNHDGAHPSRTDIDVTNMSIDATILGPSDWILGFIELSYDGSSPIDSVYTSSSHYRVANSRVFVNKAFVTIGDLLVSPFYLTFGQFYVPFGTYSSVMVSETLPKLLGRTKARAIEVGMQQQSKNSLYASAYIFRGDSHVGSVTSVKNGGINVGYKFEAGSYLKGNIGGGIIANIADSGGMQFGTGFEHFERIDHRVPAYDARATLSIGEHIDLLGEYITASTDFNPEDMSYNNKGAKPSAFDLEGSYSFYWGDKPSSIGIGYGKSNQALAMGIPLTRTSLVFNTSLLRHTIQSLEFRHDHEYAASAVATGAGDTTVPSQNGKSDNAVTAQFDYYF